MERHLVDILACPVCKGELILTVVEEIEGSVITGKLSCGFCREDYPISDSVPNLLPSSLQQPSG